MPPSENTAPQPLSEAQAVDAILGVESSEAEAPKGTTKAAEVTKGEAPVKAQDAAVTVARAPTVEDQVDQLLKPEADAADEDEPDGDESEDEEPEEDEDAESAESSDDEDAEDADPEPEVLFRMEDGTPVTVDEAKRGYLRQADYTRKTQELAQQRQQVEQAYAARRQEQQTLAESLNVALSVVEPTLAELARTNWEQLAIQDPDSYAERSILFNQAKARWQALTSRSQVLIQQKQQQDQVLRGQKLAAEAERLKMAMPDFADPKVGPKLRASIAQYARDIGLSEAEAKGITDHRLVLVLDKARRYDELQQGALGAAKKKVDKAPKRTLKGGRPKTASERKTRQSQEVLTRLRQTGSEQDALALLMS